MTQTIQIRRDSAAAWSAANPTLSSGEEGYELDTGKKKIGDGSTAWNALAYFADLTPYRTSSAQTAIDATNAAAAAAAATAAAAAQTAADARILASEKGANSGVATLGADGKIPSAQIGDLHSIERFVAASEAEMIGFSAAKDGDMCSRTDLQKTFQLFGTYSVAADWKEHITPASPVQTVNGRVGAVITAAADISDAGTKGQELVKVADAAAGRAALELGPLATATVVDGGNAAGN